MARGTKRLEFDETSGSIFMTFGYLYDSDKSAEADYTEESTRYIHSRYLNPKVIMFEERLAQLGRLEYCLATCSGIAAMFASLLSQLPSGERAAASRALGSALLTNDAEFIYDFLTPLVRQKGQP